jgi:hypothetical protein
MKNRFEAFEQFSEESLARKYPYRYCYNNKGQTMTFQEMEHDASEQTAMQLAETMPNIITLEIDRLLPWSGTLPERCKRPIQKKEKINHAK